MTSAQPDRDPQAAPAAPPARRLRAYRHRVTLLLTHDDYLHLGMRAARNGLSFQQQLQQYVRRALARDAADEIVGPRVSSFET